MTLRPPGARRWRIAVIDGPNMPNLGARDPELYGPIGSLGELQAFVAGVAAEIGVEVIAFASNFEGEILEFIHGSAATVDGYLINPAGLTTYGEATRHALADTGRPYVEVHFANLAAHLARVAPGAGLESRFTFTAAGVCMGLRHYSYAGALVGLALALDDADFLGYGARPETVQPH
jgi:3-dehydroquinate dehydratase II